MSGNPYETKKSSLQQRMDIPAGTKPAARVVRPSGRPISTSTPENSRKPTSNSRESSTAPIHVSETTQIPVLGAILERPRRSLKHGVSNAQDPASRSTASRFAQRRAKTTIHGSGFPSLNAPLGSLVGAIKSKTNRSNDPDMQSPAQQQPPAQSSQQTASTGNAQSIEALRKSSSVEAQNMLSAMSLSDIRDEVAELKQSMDPSMLAFLKNRQRNETNGYSGSRAVEQSIVNLNDQPAAKVPEEQSVHPVEDKIQMLQLLSSIKNYQDLDTAYEEYLKTDASVVSDDKIPIPIRDGTGTERSFTVACELLRSTSPLQTVWAARTVCLHLEVSTQQQYTSHRHNDTKDMPHMEASAIPTLLPVSLRCLLDANTTAINNVSTNILQTTYVLQSLYCLLQLRAHTDHVVDVTGSRRPTSSVWFQQHVLNDAVPTQPLSSCYESAKVRPLSEKEYDAKGAAAYATLSSSTSAQDDGEAFLRDPMWALLSRMRILVRLSQLLRKASGGCHESSSKTSNSTPQNNTIEMMSYEALVAICGILAMIGQRSPGAATAIVQHPTLLNDICTLALVRDDDGSSLYNATLVTPVVVLLCTLARQSRASAQGISQRLLNSSFFLQVLTLEVPLSDTAQFQLQQWTLILWRTLLRYAFGLTVLPSLLTLAARHLALKSNVCDNQPESLSPELYSCFAEVVHCIRALNNHESSTNEVAGHKSGTGSERNSPSQEERSVLSNASAWLASSKQQAIQHLRIQNGCTIKHCQGVRSVTSILRFLHSSMLVTRDMDSAVSCEKEAKRGDVTASDETACIEAIALLIDSDDFDHAATAALRSIAVPDFDDVAFAKVDPNISVEFEACASAFFDSLVMILNELYQRRSTLGANQESGETAMSCEDVVKRLRNRFFTVINTAFRENQSSSSSPSSICTARRHWLNKAHASVAIFLHETGRHGAEIERGILKDIVVAVIGRLERGEERTAAVLLSYDDLFTIDPISETDQRGAVSTVSSMLVRELCQAKRSQHQLDHSFRLQHALGLSNKGMGPFALDSLLSETDDRELGQFGGDLVLPISKYWLWKLLAGSIVDAEGSDGATEAADVVLTTLSIIDQMEDRKMDNCTTHADRLNVGAKMYYVLNICLLGEPILAYNNLVVQASALIERYISTFRKNDSHSFALECLSHSTMKSPPKEPDHEEKGTQKLEEQEKVQAILESIAPTAGDLSAPAFKSLETLVGDLIDAYLDYGAQYSLFTTCVRVFLLCGFPTKVQCLVIQRLRGFVHLLSLEESSDVSAHNRNNNMERYFRGGLPSVDQSERDSPDLLDCVAATYSKGSMSPRPDDTFFAGWTVGMLARSLATNVSTHHRSGLSVSRRRMQSLDPSIATRVVDAASAFLASPGTLASLVEIVSRSTSCQLAQGTDPLDLSCDQKWSQLMDRLEGIHQK